VLAFAGLALAAYPYGGDAALRRRIAPPVPDAAPRAVRQYYVDEAYDGSSGARCTDFRSCLPETGDQTLFDGSLHGPPR
jgi:hypothetical protein